MKELSVLQYSPACAAGDAIATRTNVDNAAADAVMILETGFIFLSISTDPRGLVGPAEPCRSPANLCAARHFDKTK
jgi:hypothetical protein